MHNIANQMHVFIYVFVLVSMHKDAQCLVVYANISLFHALHACISFFKEKHCTLIFFITEFSQKIGGGGQMHYCPPPQSVLGGRGMAPLTPLPCGGPHDIIARQLL